MKHKFTGKDLSQINHETLDRLRKHEMIDLTLRLRDFSIDLYEQLKLNSKNSSKPPSSDSPFQKNKEPDDHTDSPNQTVDQSQDQADDNKKDPSSDSQTKNTSAGGKHKCSPGRQPGSQGFGRQKIPVDYQIDHHHPQQCVICNRLLAPGANPHSGFYTFELERKPHEVTISCTLHYYYSQICDCGHENVQHPASGYESIIEGRTRNLKLSEYTIVGPMLATFIASLSRRSGMSRKKIRLFLHDWFGFDLSIGMICKSIREAGIACYPVVDDLIDQLQREDKVHMDETPWYQKGIFCWVWVAISQNIAIYQIGTRKKQQLLNLITEVFFGWLITDGYGAYRSYEKRQRCLAHLIRKAIALTGAVDKQAQKAGDWLLRELRSLIKLMAQGEAGMKPCRPILARLKRACNLGSQSDHAKLKSVAKEILNDWDAVVAFVKNPGLPATNNEAERALRWVVLYRKITFGTRTEEGSQSFAALISVIETWSLRNMEPWTYIAQSITRGRKGLAPLPIE